MTYRVNFHAAASAQIPGIPAEAWQALVEELLIIGADPHHRGVPDPDDPRYREQVFGGTGLVSYVIDDEVQVVHVFSIVWAG
ncbi:hypothetical protein [Nonomuraea sp. NPDC049695]|uniref:type II toxin-antitoxin system RelE family toxin n=1 Tax=Nonomuraea sp. NPDC049695 TaxID=3154734 RepID=UPI0034240946